MRVKHGFELIEIMNEWMVVPLGENMLKVDGIISFSESGAYLWRYLIEGMDLEKLIASLRSEYDIDKKTAERDVCEFLDCLNKVGLLEGC